MRNGSPGWSRSFRPAAQRMRFSSLRHARPAAAFDALLAAGPDFAQGKVVELPAGNQDIAPTVLALEGLPLPQTLDGRVLSEAFRRASKPPLKASSRRFQASA